MKKSIRPILPASGQKRIASGLVDYEDDDEENAVMCQPQLKPRPGHDGTVDEGGLLFHLVLARPG